jgi:hypothetical protein
MGIHLCAQVGINPENQRVNIAERTAQAVYINW